MPRQRPIEYPGAIYHALNRGDRREPIFQDDADRRRFLQTLGEACAKTDLPREILGQRTVWLHCNLTTNQPNRTNLVSKVRSDPFTNPAIASRLQSDALVGRVAELASPHHA